MPVGPGSGRCVVADQRWIVIRKHPATKRRDMPLVLDGAWFDVDALQLRPMPPDGRVEVPPGVVVVPTNPPRYEEGDNGQAHVYEVLPPPRV